MHGIGTIHHPGGLGLLQRRFAPSHAPHRGVVTRTRIYDAALSSAQLQASAAAGPDYDFAPRVNFDARRVRRLVRAESISRLSRAAKANAWVAFAGIGEPTKGGL